MVPDKTLNAALDLVSRLQAELERVAAVAKLAQAHTQATIDGLERLVSELRAEREKRLGG
jgi:hypothetical protein